jgi:hypothetical protein
MVIGDELQGVSYALNEMFLFDDGHENLRDKYFTIEDTEGTEKK